MWFLTRYKIRSQLIFPSKEGGNEHFSSPQKELRSAEEIPRNIIPRDPDQYNSLEDAMFSDDEGHVGKKTSN